ncbi:MAG: threonine synthase [Acidimicrobiia bacterium]|jgi:threonine synthase
MRYVSTRGRAPTRDFEEVLLEGLAPDGGLYVPELWPQLGEIRPGAPYHEVVTAVMEPLVAGSPLDDSLADLVRGAYESFRHPEVAPLRRVGEDVWLLELFWGPTLSFKDYALQVLGRMLDVALGRRGRRALVVGATSGDTGSAAMEALRDREAVDVVILFPHGRVSEVQRRQMTTVGAPNVHAVAVDGTFDDCQDLVKACFGDPTVRDELSLAAVNSINWARIAAQAGYHVWTAEQVPDRPVVSIPTGNFGNVLSAHVAKAMGAPIGRLVVANNANHGLHRLVVDGRLPISPVAPTLAPAMDIQVPSNLERYLFEILDRSGSSTARTMAGYREQGGFVLDEIRHHRMTEDFGAGWAGDAEIEQVIGEVSERWGITLDPHTAVAWKVGVEHRIPGRPLVVVATAHPAKFPEAVAEATGEAPRLPPGFGHLWSRDERFERIPADRDTLVDLLRSVAG